MGVDHVPGYELDHRMMYWSMVNVNMVYKMMFVILARKLFFSGCAIHRNYIHNENHSNNLLKS